jgi:hypothetical protein
MRKIYRITYCPKGRWLLCGGKKMQVFRLQRDAVKKGVQICHHHEACGRLTQLVLHGRKHIRWERTYPRKSDPRKSKG